nr:toll/interleukin-1 receptor domain-containing protein [Sphingomonas sp. R-74633]
MLQQIGSELQSRYTFAELDAFFAAVGISTADYEHGGSKRIYAVDVLKHRSEAEILRIAAELELVSNGAVVRPNEPPANWKNTKAFRLFISHISVDKAIATRLKEALAPFEIAGFVAHEDIHPTLAWQDEIERALYTMDAMVAVHTKGFSASFWTQQEIGFALGRGVKIVSFKYGEDPTGFIGKHQALPRLRRTADQIAEEINRLLSGDSRTADRLKDAQDVWPSF